MAASFLFQTQTANAAGTVYYVDSSITDTNVASATADCTNYNPSTFVCSGGSASAYKTVADINAKSFAADDQILFRKGQVWREQLTVTSSGSAGHPITFGSFGSGALPIFNGANLVSSWTTETSNTAAYVQGISTNGAPSSGSLSLAFSSPNVAGNTIIVSVLHNEPSASFSCSDSKGNTYSTAVSTSSGDFTLGKAQICYAPNIQAGANTVQINGVSNYTFIHIHEYSGILTSSPLDVTAGATGTSAAPNSGSTTTTSANDLIFGYGYIQNTSTLAAGSGFTGRLTSGPFSYSEDKTVTSAGSNSASMTASPSAEWIMLMAAFKASTSSIYYASAVSQPNQVFRDEARLTRVSSKNALVSGSWWWDSGASRVYVYDNPSGHAMEVSQRTYAVLSDCSYRSDITFQDMQIQMAQTNGLYVCDAAPGGNFNINNVFAQKNFTAGIRLDGPPNSAVRSSTVAYNGSDGLNFYETANLLIDGVTAHDNAQLADTDFTSGIKGNDGTRGSTNVVIQNSTSYSNGIGQATGYRGSGIWIDTIGDGAIVRYNTTYSNNLSGINIDADNNEAIYANLSYNNAGGGILVYADGQSSMTGNVIYNNSAYGNQGAGLQVLGPSAGSSAGGCMNNIARNNIVTDTTSGPNFVAFYGCENPGANGSGNVYTNNALGPQASNFIQWGGTIGSPVYKSTYAAFDTAYGSPAHSITTDPLFVNPGSANFTLQASSPVINTGANLGTTYQLGLNPSSTWPSGVTTLNQNLNGSAWDLGAYVYTQSTAPVVSITAPSASSTISGTSVALTATASATSPASIASVQFKIDGANVGSPDTSAPYTTILDSATLTNTTHSITAVALDTYGNSTTSSAVSITVNNAGGGLPAGSYNPPVVPTGGFKVSINNDATSTTSQNVTLSFNAGSDVTKMAISNTLDFNGIGQENYSSTKSWNLCVGLPSCTLGSKTVYVKFYTAAGQPSNVISSSIDLSQEGVITPLPPPTSQTALINSNGTFFLIQNNQRQGIANPGILFTYGFDFKDARFATSDDLAVPVGPNLTPKDGALVKTSINPTVYLISGNQKHGFTSANVFLALGYKFPSVLTVTIPELDIVPLGDVISTTTQRHVKGTNVSNSGTVYYMGDTQRFPYPSLEVFNSWNIDNDFSRVVPANSEDLKLPVGNVLGMR